MLAVPSNKDGIIDRIVEEEGISHEEAERRFMGMLQFLKVASVANAPVSPSKAIDSAWHAFILFTIDYAAYCKEHLDRFVHHQPTSAEVNNRDNYVRARTLAEELFGSLDESVWPLPEKNLVAAGVGDCGNDCGSCGQYMCADDGGRIHQRSAEPQAS